MKLKKIYPPFVNKKYQLGYFKLKPTKDFNSVLFLYYRDEFIGHIDLDEEIDSELDKNTIYFNLNESKIIEEGLVMHTVLEMGYASFKFRLNKWKLKEVYLRNIPQKYIFERFVLIEKDRYKNKLVL